MTRIGRIEHGFVLSATICKIHIIGVLFLEHGWGGLDGSASGRTCLTWICFICDHP